MPSVKIQKIIKSLNFKTLSVLPSKMRLSMALRRVTKLSEDLAILAYVAIDQLLLGGYGGGVVGQDLPAPRGVFY